MIRKAIFIADAHLKYPSSPEYRDLVRFLGGIAADDVRPDVIFILGDLFDFFVGFPGVIFYAHMELLSALSGLCGKGIRVFYFEGNHDFFLKKLNAEGFPVEFVEKSMRVDLDGQWYVSHGDMINRKDYGHRLLAALVKNPVTEMLTRILPPYLVFDFAHFFSRFSRANISSKKIFREHIFDDFIRRESACGYSGAILGHFHRSATVNRQIGERPFPVHLVGSWKDDRSYLSYEDGQFLFRHFR